MKASRTSWLLVPLLLSAVLVTGCSQLRGQQWIVAGQSSVSGDEAVREANNFVANAAAHGCKAISVGGFGAGGEGLIIGVPVLLDCPLGAPALTPTGTAVP